MTTEQSEERAGVAREFSAPDGSRWEAIAPEAVVAHGKLGAVLAFRPAGGTGSEPLRTTVTFNSQRAAAGALRTMSEMELRRRLAIARAAAAGV